MYVVDKEGIIKGPTHKPILDSPSALSSYAERLGKLCGKSLHLMIRISKVLQMRQETSLVLFLKAQHGITPQRERTLP